MPKKTQKERRDESAEKVCRELRYQLVQFGCIADYDAIMKQINSWMRVAKKNKYIRPK